MSAQNQGASVLSDGASASDRYSRLSQLFTAGWKEELVLSDNAYGVTVGGVSAGADVSLVAGGGAGTTIDSDQPELIVSVPSGYYMIPLFFHCAAQVDLDADAEVGNIILFADRTQGLFTSPTGTQGTIVPLLDGGSAGVGNAWHTITADITDPVVSQLLDYQTIRAADAGAAASEQVIQLVSHWDPSVPTILQGPCSVVACWGGTAAVNAMCVFHWAELPSNVFA